MTARNSRPQFAMRKTRRDLPQAGRWADRLAQAREARNRNLKGWRK